MANQVFANNREISSGPQATNPSTPGKLAGVMPRSRPAELRTLRNAPNPDNATPKHSPARQPTGSMPADQGEQA